MVERPGELRKGRERIEKGSRERIEIDKKETTSILTSACCSASSRHCISPEFPT